ncbi:Hypothetical protein R9X50_00426500 [Acrodontium crateriforme]|uniref:Phosphatidylinositol N-acetylglucosaminyltransferase n=1 Tax=Acrodontium crateriforme TaxID=150365 RepID=A0AAQ3M508_9PEZI|nr:Hypothetical protein R9X50_00426500 [Acrodontium crateriforme]
MSPPYDSASASLSSRASSIQPEKHNSRLVDSDFLRPEDAIYINSPPRKMRKASPLGRSDTMTTATAGLSDARKRRDKRRGRSSSRRRKGTWKKLLWVKQSYPDNYTDEETFLDHLQRNPRLRPYEFWPLVADSTIIVQHVCSVVIFVCCFTAIIQKRVSPQTVVSWATIGTVAGWLLREYWQNQEEAKETANRSENPDFAIGEDYEKPSTLETSRSGSVTAEFGMPLKEQDVSATSTSNGASRIHSRNPSASSLSPNLASSPLSTSNDGNGSPVSSSLQYIPPYNGQPSAFSPRMQERLITAKSAVLIYCSLLGLSPILKSLTKSTSSDSIWALSSWLMGINVFTFDYGAGPEAKFPASLSTNAALMASTVLASRLPTTTHVFSLTLFSIEVFGLFPVFRRHLRHHSWAGHLVLTTILVIIASGGLSMTISGGGWAMGVVGVILGGIVMSLSMGITSWWLIGLQRYKNEIHGPWDPARPIIRRHWD